MTAKLQSNIDQVIREMRRRAASVADDSAARIVAHVRSDMAGPKSGRTSEQGGVTQRDSAPGEAPAIDHGTYAGSFRVVDVGETEKAVGTDDERGPVLELGGTRTAPRPHLGPAFEAEAPRFESDLRGMFEE